MNPRVGFSCRRDGKLKTNTVHVRDVAAACWHVCSLAAPAGVYNLADATDAAQAHLAAALQDLFGISTGFVGNMSSSAMKAIGLKRVAEDYNDKHMEAWQELCKAHGITSTVLTPCAPVPQRPPHHLPPPRLSAAEPRRSCRLRQLH